MNVVVSTALSFVFLAIQAIATTPAPLTLEPREALARAGQPVVLTAASIFKIVTWQWLKDGTLIPGATAAQLVIPSSSVKDAGTYTVKATTAFGSRSWSSPVGIVDTAPTARVLYAGQRAVFECEAAGPHLSFQWLRDGVPLAESASVQGTTTAKLVLPQVQRADEAEYACTVTLRKATLTTSDSLTVLGPPQSVQPPERTSWMVGEQLFRECYYFNSWPVTRFRVTGLPPGLAVNTATGELSGCPRQAGTYDVRVMASNPAGSSPPATFRFIIRPLPEALVGQFFGAIAGGPSLTGGAPFHITVSPSGGFSAVLRLPTNDPVPGGGGLRGVLRTRRYAGTLLVQDDGDRVAAGIGFEHANGDQVSFQWVEGSALQMAVRWIIDGHFEYSGSVKAVRSVTPAVTGRYRSAFSDENGDSIPGSLISMLLSRSAVLTWVAKLSPSHQAFSGSSPVSVQDSRFNADFFGFKPAFGHVRVREGGVSFTPTGDAFGAINELRGDGHGMYMIDTPRR